MSGNGESRTGTGVGSPKPLSRTTVVALSVVTIATVVYASCSTQPNVHIIIFIPPSTHKLRKYALSLFPENLRAMFSILARRRLYVDRKT